MTAMMTYILIEVWVLMTDSYDDLHFNRRMGSNDRQLRLPTFLTEEWVLMTECYETYIFDRSSSNGNYDDLYF